MKNGGSWVSYCEIRGVEDHDLNVKKTMQFLLMKELVCCTRRGRDGGCPVAIGRSWGGRCGLEVNWEGEWMQCHVTGWKAII